MKINWFTENYIENRKLCEFLLEKAEIKYSFTREQFYEGCFELRKGKTDKDLLETHIKLLGELSLVGINASIAGAKIREALIDSHTKNQTNNINEAWLDFLFEFGYSLRIVYLVHKIKGLKLKNWAQIRLDKKTKNNYNR